MEHVIDTYRHDWAPLLTMILADTHLSFDPIQRFSRPAVPADFRLNNSCKVALPRYSSLSIATSNKMSGASKGISVFLRFWQIISDAIVLAIVASFLHIISQAGVYANARLVYTVCVASVGIIFSVILFFPFIYSFLAFPLDAVLAILWLVVFCLLESVRAHPMEVTVGKSFY